MAISVLRRKRLYILFKSAWFLFEIGLLTSIDLIGCCTFSEIELWTWSDHASVETTFYLQNTFKLKMTWRLNPELLLMKKVKTDIRKELDEYFEFNRECGVSKALIWDAMKATNRRSAD